MLPFAQTLTGSLMFILDIDAIRPLLVEEMVLEITRRYLRDHETDDLLAFADYDHRLAAHQHRMKALADQLALHMET